MTETAATIPYQRTLYVQAANALIVQFQQIHNLACCLDNQSSACQLTLLKFPIPYLYSRRSSPSGKTAGEDVPMDDNPAYGVFNLYDTAKEPKIE